MASKLVLVDYENIQNLDGIDKMLDYDMKVLVGKNQTKIPIDLVLQDPRVSPAVKARAPRATC